MTRVFGLLLVCVLVASCGGSPYASRNAASYRGPATPAPSVLFATGPIKTACEAAGRKQASRARCGCVQAVADMELSAAQQRRGAGYFRDPHALQEVRQSSQSNPSNGRFWTAWKAFGARAEALCN
ncbi:MAG: hypothetical protein AAGM84_00745 [Pseudomonadota bacterium]